MIDVVPVLSFPFESQGWNKIGVSEMTATKSRQTIKTVWDECKNRRYCRQALDGVFVRITDIAEEDIVVSNWWGSDSHLMLRTAGGFVARAEGCELIAVWPVACCSPKVRHEWNALTTATRKRILTRDGPICRKCGSTYILQIDHVHPIAKGGTDRDSNLQVLCRRCNLAKSAEIEDDGV